MTSPRLFTCAFFTTAGVDLLAHALTHAGPDALGINGIGRLVICLALGYLGARALKPLAVLLSTLAGLIAATFLTVCTYIVTGLAVAEANGPHRVFTLLLVTVLLTLVGTLLGIIGRHAMERTGRPHAA
jgi:hypothetical protein